MVVEPGEMVDGVAGFSFLRGCVDVLYKTNLPRCRWCAGSCSHSAASTVRGRRSRRNWSWGDTDEASDKDKDKDKDKHKPAEGEMQADV